MALLPAYHPTPPTRKVSSRGFTLIELLTCIAIIAILAALLLPVASKVRRSASSSKCSAQMRAIGGAIQNYTTDNHNRLPTSPTYGGLHTGQGPWFNRDDRRLQMLIGSYMDSPAGTTWSTTGSQMNYDPAYAWPAWESESQAGAPSILLNSSVKFEGSTSASSPWAGTKITGTNTYLGKNIRTLSTPAQAVAFQEVDQMNTTAGWKNLIPASPVHGSYRNALYFDWHVGRIEIAD